MEMAMSEVSRAKGTSIVLGTVYIEVFQLPSGEYRLSQSQVTEAIGKPNRSIIQFLDGKSPEALHYKEFELSNSLAVEGSNKPITPIPIQIATAYWRYWDKKGNSQATAIIDGCIVEAIERRADKAFGVYRSEEEYNQCFMSVTCDSVSLLHQVNQLIEIIKVNVSASQALNKAVHTLMHNQTNTLRAAHEQATALLNNIKNNELVSGNEVDFRLKGMEAKLQELAQQISDS
jgi:hypothetical protein